MFELSTAPHEVCIADDNVALPVDVYPTLKDAVTDFTAEAHHQFNEQREAETDIPDHPTTARASVETAIVEPPLTVEPSSEESHTDTANYTPDQPTTEPQAIPPETPNQNSPHSGDRNQEEKQANVAIDAPAAVSGSGSGGDGPPEVPRTGGEGAEEGDEERPPEAGDDSNGTLDHVGKGQSLEDIWKAVEQSDVNRPLQRIKVGLPDGRCVQVTIEPLQGGKIRDTDTDASGQFDSSMSGSDTQNSKPIEEKQQAAGDALKDLPISPYNHPELYEALGIDPKKLVEGVVVEVEPLDIVSHVPGGKDDLYHSTDERFPYYAGAVGEVIPHVTLNYGFMRPPTEIRPQIDQVLEGWSPEEITIAEVIYYTSRVDTEPFYCIAGKVELTPNLLEGNARLNLIPHVHMYPNGYEPHITFAYIKKDPAVLEKWLRHMSDRFVGRRLPVRRGLNYGR